LRSRSQSFFSVCAALSAAASKGGAKRLKSGTYRRLNLGLAACSAWLAAAAIFYPNFATGYNQYSPELANLAGAVHGATAALAAGVWARSLPTSPLSSPFAALGGLVRGLVGSIWSLSPRAQEGEPLDDPAARRDPRAEYALAAALFGLFAVLPFLRAFPAATVPTILGKRLGRPATAFTFLAAVSSYCLKDAAERGRLSASTFVTLRKGLLVGSGLHLSLIVAKVLGADGGAAGLREFYPAMVSRPLFATVSFVMHGIALVAALTPLPSTDSESSPVA